MTRSHSPLVKTPTPRPFSRQAHTGPQTFIGEMFGGLFAKGGKTTPTCAFSGQMVY